VTLRSRCQRGGRVPGFSMIEMMVVVLIISILIVIALPAFNRLIASNTEAQGAELVRSAITLARSAALSGPPGRDSAAVFFFEPGGVATVVTCVRVGSINDERLESGTPERVEREVFAPLPGASVIALPRGVSVRGFVRPGVLDAAAAAGLAREWYGGTNGVERYGVDNGRGDWVFPETGFYKTIFESGAELRGSDDGFDRSTFMVRFEGQTGRVAVGRPGTVLVIAPRPSPSGRPDTRPWSLHRLDLAPAMPAAFERVLADASLTDQERRELLGTTRADRRSSDVVLAGPVTELAVADEAALIGGLGLGLRPDPFTGTLYRLFANDAVNANASVEWASLQRSSADIGPRFIRRTGEGQPPVDLARRVARWIEGEPNVERDTTDPRTPRARLLTVQPGSGAVVELTVALPENTQ
jgi:prepilin-type N-terminal cleavage/methylation domain-containing protein